MNNGDCTIVTVGHGLHETRCEHAQLILFLDSTIIIIINAVYCR
jgi:hypothetical protein